MSKITIEKILQKLANLTEYIGYLKKLAKETQDDQKLFLSDFHLFGSAERYLQLAIQALMDTIKIVLIEAELDKPDDNQEAISALYNKKIISGDLAQRLEGVVGFRNILVHEYGKIDKLLIYRYLQENIKDLEDFKKEMVKYLKKRSLKK